MDHSLPGSFVFGIVQTRILEWVAISFSRDLPHPRIEHASVSCISCIAGRFFTAKPPGKPILGIAWNINKKEVFDYQYLVRNSLLFQTKKV